MKRRKSQIDSVKEIVRGLSAEEQNLRIEDENRKLKQQLKEVRRESGLFKILSASIREQPPFSTFSFYKQKNKKAKIRESAVLVLSDCHADQEILKGRVHGLEDYNFDEACRRMEHITDTTISHLKENMANYKFDKIYILGLGDYVSGEIHNAREHSEWRNSLKNAMAVGELLACMIADLSKYFEEIIFCSVSGNHGRRTTKKDYRGAQDNWDYLVVTHAATRLKNLIDENRLKTIFPDSWSMGININGWNFVLNHGDSIKAWNTVPFYGIETKTRRLTSIGAVSGDTPHYFLYGHFHNMASQQTTCGEVIINGSFVATDEFALEGLGVYSQPFQWLFGVHPKYGVSWRLPIKLKTDNKKGQISRYKITI